MKSSLVVFGLFEIALGHTAFAGAIERLGGVGPVAGAMSGAYIAVSDDCGATFYYNPAGLGQVKGTCFQLGAEALFPEFTYTFPMGKISEHSRNGQVYALPLLGFSHQFGRLTTGLGINTTYGLGANFTDPGGLLPATKSLITLTNMSPAVAFRLTRKVFVGGQINVGYSQFTYNAPVLQAGRNIGAYTNKGTGWGVGGTFGVLWNVRSKISVGASYVTKTTVNIHGDTNLTLFKMPFTDRFSSALTFPSRLGFGLAYRPTDRWIFAADGNVFNYQDSQTLLLKFHNLPDQTQHLGWTDNFSIHAGVSRKLGRHWTVRGGIGYQTSVIPDQTTSTLTPDATGWDVSGGIGYTVGKYTLNASYIHPWAHRTIAISPDNVQPGQYAIAVPTVALALGFRKP